MGETRFQTASPVMLPWEKTGATKLGIRKNKLECGDNVGVSPSEYSRKTLFSSEKTFHCRCYMILCDIIIG
jgi:hypothetical protein